MDQRDDLTRAARQLRRDMTPAESVLWKQLRGSRMSIRFRRQAPLLGYVVDFLSKHARLVIELDGAVHEDSNRDVDRDLTLQRNGFRVFRIENVVVFEQMEDILQEIQRLIDDPSAEPTSGFR